MSEFSIRMNESVRESATHLRVSRVRVLTSGDKAIYSKEVLPGTEITLWTIWGGGPIVGIAWA